MKHYTKVVKKHFYEVTCPHCNKVMVFDKYPYMYENGWLCENCFKWFTDNDFEEVKPPERKVEYLKWSREA